MCSHTKFDQINTDIKNLVYHKTYLTYEDSVSLAKIAESGIRVLETKIDDINEKHEDIRKIIVDDKQSITNLHIDIMNNCTDAINEEHNANINCTHSSERLKILDDQIDDMQKDITDMLDYCDIIIEKANEWLVTMCKNEIYNSCQFKKIEQNME